MGDDQTVPLVASSAQPRSANPFPVPPLPPKLVIDDESFDLDEITIPEQQPPPSASTEGNSRKSSNSASHSSSFRRKLSGCFRKQDSHEWPMINSDTPTSVDQPINQPTISHHKKDSWYKKATNKIIQRHRSVSEERRPSTPIYGLQHDDPYRVNVSQIELSTNIYADPRLLASSHSIDDGRRRYRASSFLSACTSNNPPNIVASDSNINDINRHPGAAALRASYHGALQKPFSEVVGSAESLVGRVLVEQGLGKYVDPAVLRVTQRELAESLNMTQEGK